MPRKWLDPGQPQTLVGATFILYLDAVFAAVQVLQFQTVHLGSFAGPYFLVRIAGGVAAGLGIANEKKWGYWGGLFVAVFPFLLGAVHTPHRLVWQSTIDVLFQLLLIGLLVHPDSRNHQKVWFK